MRFLSFVTALFLGLALSCPTRAEDLALELLTSGPNAAPISSSNSSGESTLIKTSRQWDSFLRRFPGVGAVSKPNFRAKMVLAVVLPQPASGGQRVEISRVVVDPGVALHVIVETASLTSTTQAPFCLVSVDKRREPVTFETRTAPAPVLPTVKSRILDSGAQSRVLGAAPQSLTLRDRAAFESFWTQHSSAPLPKVDLRSETVIAVLAGARPSSGFEVILQGIEETASEILVKTALREPAAGSFQATLTTHPYLILAVASRSLKIRVQFQDLAPPRTSLTELSLRVDERGRSRSVAVDISGRVRMTDSPTQPGGLLYEADAQLSVSETQAIFERARDAEVLDQASDGAGPFVLEAADRASGRSVRLRYADLRSRGREFIALHEVLLDRLQALAAQSAARLDFSRLTYKVEQIFGGGVTHRRELIIESDGRAIEIAPFTIMIDRREGRISDADLALIMSAMEQADLRQRPSDTSLRSAARGLTTLIIEFAGGRLELVHETGSSPPAPKSAEIAQLEEILDRVGLVTSAFNFDELSYGERAVVSGTERSLDLTISKSGVAVLKKSSDGRVESLERVTLLPDQLEEMDRFLGQTNPFLTVFAPFVPSSGAMARRVEARKGGQSNAWSYSEPRDLSLDAQRRLHEALARLLAEGLRSEGFRDLSFVREERATKVGRLVRIQGDRVDLELSLRGQYVHGESRALTEAERQVLQAAYQGADLRRLPGRLPENSGTWTSTTLMSLREGSIHRSIQGSDRSIEPAGYTTLRSALEALLATWNPDLFELRGVVRVSSRRTDIVPEYERLEVAGPLKSALSAFKDREVVVQARLDSKGRILVTAIYGQPEVVAEGLLQLNGTLGRSLKNGYRIKPTENRALVGPG
jgi:hypothetical protein